ncbi:MAG: hypothetical protein WBA66_01295 [Xanthobacteraceae bacterium]
MLIPSPRFFVVPLATACVLIALAMTQRPAPQADSAAVLVVPAAKMQVCGTTSQDRACTLPAG